MTDLRDPASGTAPPAATSPGPTALKRTIGPVGGTLLTLSCLTPASSLFVIVPGSFATLGTGTALALVIATLLCVAVAFCYSELGTLIPSAGGEYAMVGTLVGRFGGWLAFLQALVVVMIVPPIMAIGTAQYLAPIVTIDPKLLGAAVMLLSTVMGLLDLRANAWITGFFLTLEVVAAGVVAALGFGHTRRSASVLLHPIVGGSGTAAAVSVGTLIAGLAAALFVTQGFSTAVYLAEDMENPRRNVSRTVLATLGIGVAVILIPVVAITLGAPSLDALTGGDIAAMVQQWSDKGVGTFVSLCIALAIVNAAIVMVIQNSRVLFASARDNTWPGPVNRLLAGTSKRFGAPWLATLAVGIPGAVLCYVPVATLSGVTGVAVVTLYGSVAVGALFARRAPHGKAAAWRMPLWPLLPVLLLAALAYVLTQQVGRDLIITASITVVGALYWLLYLRPRRATHWLIMVPTEPPLSVARHEIC